MNQTHNVLEICKAGISSWQEAFNRGDAKGCADQYAENAVMQAKPFGSYTGRKEIEAFWQKIIKDGFSDVSYTEVEWKPVGEDGYILTSQWTMNKAHGVVHQEHWKIQADGCARLVFDEFEVLGER
ncbi:nuclear transport factor 2 family protein [Motiliproteus sp. MSK22-1]|uniref:YybH family protein n=1 Tax=Motiliproteus sp. MSK22-1 TaxID=1897630 RepID=UPI0009760E5F|nr:nuclear transport factor 2 family protein [Motiliproteus sp. MSK22-1]OMH39276.1 isochorismatase [Motiliproteus sp. MSK22-1]